MLWILDELIFNLQITLKVLSLHVLTIALS